jgi:hypothetical protein
MGFLLLSKYKYCFFLWFQDIPVDFFLAITTIVRYLGCTTPIMLIRKVSWRSSKSRDWESIYASDPVEQ